MGLKLRIQASPVFHRIGVAYATRWAANRYFNPGTTARPGDEAFNEGFWVDPQAIVLTPDQNARFHEMIDGSRKSYQSGKPRWNLSMRKDCLSSDDLRILAKIIRSGRPFAVGAWYDQYTTFMSHFGRWTALSEDVSTAHEIGEFLSGGCFRRDNNTTHLDYWPSPFAGNDHMRHIGVDVFGQATPKFVNARVGSGILLETKGMLNLAPHRKPLPSGAGFMFRTLDAGVLQGYSNASPLATTDSIAEMLVFPTNLSYTTKADTDSITVVAEAPYTATIWIRGTGTFQLHWSDLGGGSSVGTGTQTAQAQYTPVTYQFTPGAGVTTGKVRLLGSGHFEIACINVTAGKRPSLSFIDYSTASGATWGDSYFTAIRFNHAGWTLSLLFRFNNVAEDAILLNGDVGGTQKRKLYINGTTVYYTHGAETVSWSGLTTAETGWCHLHLVCQKSNNAGKTGLMTLYENGTNLGSNQLTVLPFDYNESVYLGAQHVSGATVSAMTVIDSCRFDARPWSAQEIADDAAAFGDDGIRAILEILHGRYFTPRGSLNPQAQAFTDLWDTRFEFEEADHSFGGPM